MPAILCSSEEKPQVKAIRQTDDIQKIRELLKFNPMHFLLFEIAIGTGMRAKQLLQLKVKDLQRLISGEMIHGLKGEGKTRQAPGVGEALLEAYHCYLSESSPTEKDFVFRSRKGGGPLTVASASRLVRGWFEKAGLDGLNGFLTLRKTWQLHHSWEVEPNPEKPIKIPDGRSIETYLQPVRAPTVNEVVYKSLEQAIVSGQIPPGSKLVVEKLAHQMKVSNIPVREALARLEARNLITIVPKKGAVVIDLSPERINELLEIRLVLESAAAEKTISVIKEETLEMLEKINEEYISGWKSWDVSNLLAASKKFHDCLYRDALIPILRQMIDQIWHNVSPYYHIMFKNEQTEPYYSGAAAHSNIIQGLRERDREKVLFWLKKDLTEAAKFVSEALGR